MTAAGRQRRYRDRQRAAGVKSKRAARVQVNTRPTAWDGGEFVAVDGEGFSEGQDETVCIKQSNTLYRGKEHFYAYLAASDGSEIYAPGEHCRLQLGECLDFLCQIRERNRNAILVIFGGSYDVTQMVCHDLSADEIKNLIGKGKERGALDIDIDGYQYRLEYRPRKSFTIYRWNAGERKWCWKKDKRVMTPHLRVVLWDVIGFFQERFTEVMKKWIPGDPDFNMIEREKGNRNIFARSDMATIKKYNAAELRCLVKIMEAVRAAANDLSIKLRRWDGAGAIAAALMQKYDVKKSKGKCPEEVFTAARHAYSGGHIETYKLGFHTEGVHHYDINSAYPSVFRNLPDLSTGNWTHGAGEPPSGFTVVRIRYSFPWGQPFYPLFHRKRSGEIIYPDAGGGWYWYPEYEAARQYMEKCGGEISIDEWWHFAPEKSSPFGWIDDVYEYRKELAAMGKTGPVRMLKSGFASLYGKCAQQVGARFDEDGVLHEPSYFQLEWAGYVTAGCRAQLMVAALQSPADIIAIATDGLFSTVKLDLYTPKEKILGAWEYKLHDGITMVMPGVYWLHDGETMQNYSRGYKKSEMEDAAFIHDAWRAKQKSVTVDIERLIGLSSAANSKEFWKMRGRFVTSSRSLKLNGDNSKRAPVMLYNHRPEKELVSTVPKTHDYGEDLDGEIFSAPYPISWIDGGGTFTIDHAEGEMADEREAMDAIHA